MCSGWRVHDIAAHLPDSDLGRLSLHRDGYRAPDSPQEFTSYRELVGYLDRLNAGWVSYKTAAMVI